MPTDFVRPDQNLEAKIENFSGDKYDLANLLRNAAQGQQSAPVAAPAPSQPSQNEAEGPTLLTRAVRVGDTVTMVRAYSTTGLDTLERAVRNGQL